MPTITTPDGVKIFYKDWGSGQPIVFSHGWPLSADDWDAQMMFFLHHGYRVIAHDRRGHGRSEQVGTGNDMDHWVADLAALTEHLGVRDAIHIGHSTGGGEVARYVARHQERVAKAVLVASLTPNMVKTDANPAGQPQEWFDAVKSGMLGNRSDFYRAVPEGPFYGFNRPGAKPSEAVIANWWRQDMAGSAQAHYESVFSWLEDYTEDLKKITLPVLHAWRRRPDRPVRQFGAPRGRPARERCAKDIPWLPARYADYPRGRPQPRPSRVHQILTGRQPEPEIGNSSGALHGCATRLTCPLRIRLLPDADDQWPVTPMLCRTELGDLQGSPGPAEGGSRGSPSTTLAMLYRRA